MADRPRKKPEFEFRTTDRNGKVAVWVSMPDGTEWNIWDLRKNELTPTVKDALRNAFKLGQNAAKQQLQGVVDNLVRGDTGWKDD